MAYKIRVILDVEEDVIRDIIVPKTITLDELHRIIAQSFGFKGLEIASFYKTTHEWEQGEEIPLCNMSDDETAISMETCTINQVLKSKGDKLIYLYDFFAMWTFFVELSEVDIQTTQKLPAIAFSFGNTPDEAPAKTFTAEDNLGDSDFLDDESHFENIDDFDF